jgi:hypothetical protein
MIRVSGRQLIEVNNDNAQQPVLQVYFRALVDSLHEYKRTMHTVQVEGYKKHRRPAGIRVFVLRLTWNWGHWRD